MNVDRIDFLGWKDCLRLANPQAELIITTEVGPRILSYSTNGTHNVLHIEPSQAGGRGETEWMVRGGHRLWVAPENDRTYEPDNSPVSSEVLGPGSVRLVNPATAPWHVQKELTITLLPGSATVQLGHRLINCGTTPTELASWALSVMRPGGLEIIPQPPMGEHPRDLLPNRLIVPWAYTDFTDARWRLGRDFITLRQEAGSRPTKVGLFHTARWVAYALPEALFVKTFSFEQGARYPDFGCNFETFTNAEMLEIETLGPLRTLAPGESVAHGETWQLLPSSGLPPATDDASLHAWLAPQLAPLGLA